MGRKSAHKFFFKHVKVWSKTEIKGQIWHENVCPDSNFTINILLNHLVHMLNCSDIVKRESMGMGGLFFLDGMGLWVNGCVS